MDGQRWTHTMASMKSISISIGLLALGLPEKQSVCNAVTTLDELRQAITDEMQAIPATMVHSATLEAGLLLSIDGLQLRSRT